MILDYIDIIKCILEVFGEMILEDRVLVIGF